MVPCGSAFLGRCAGDFANEPGPQLMSRIVETVFSIVVVCVRFDITRRSVILSSLVTAPSALAAILITKAQDPIKTEATLQVRTFGYSVSPVVAKGSFP